VIADGAARLPAIAPATGGRRLASRRPLW